MERERPQVLSFVLSADQAATVEEAIQRAITDAPGSSRGAAVTHLATTYLEEGRP